MDPSDFQRVEQELQQHVQGLSPLQSKGLQNAQAWSSALIGSEHFYNINTVSLPFLFWYEF